MKKYLVIICIGLVGFATLSFLYFKSQSDFNIDHQQTMSQFAEIQQSDTAIDKEILSLQYFVTDNGESLNEPMQAISDFCNLNVKQYFLDSRSLAYDAAFEKFCHLETIKFENIKTFQQINTEYRNAVLFLKTRLAWLQSHPNGKVSGQEHAAEDLVKSALIYALMPQSELQVQLEQALKTQQVRRLLPDVARNISQILQSRVKLSDLADQIITSKAKVLANDLRELYFDDYLKDQKMASRYRIFLFIASLVLVAFVIYNSFLLVKASKNLQQANETLETRVRQRTQELTESQDKILQQQQALINVSKMSALGEMAAGIAHEINTPLATIQMRATHLAEILQNEVIDKTVLLKSLEKIDLTTQRIAKIIKGLLVFSRDGKSDQKELASVHKIVHETFDLCKERFKHSHVQLDFISEGDVMLYCHPTAISQVLLNFLNNSFDAVQGLNEKWIRVQLDLLEETIIISITDSGFGIPFEIQEKIMQPFFTTKEIGKGTGLGLSISKGIIHDHLGTVGLDNTSPHTRFVITFPRI